MEDGMSSGTDALIAAAQAFGLDAEVVGCAASASTLNYNSHLLLAQGSSGGATVVMRWEHAPSQAEIDKRRAELPAAYSSFVLVRPCGPVMNGNGDVST